MLGTRKRWTETEVEEMVAQVREQLQHEVSSERARGLATLIIDY